MVCVTGTIARMCGAGTNAVGQGVRISAQVFAIGSVRCAITFRVTNISVTSVLFLLDRFCVRAENARLACG